MGRNRRSGNTIASRSNGSTGGIGIGAENAEMSQRLNDRIEAQDITVQVRSQTRGTIEDVIVHFDPAAPGQVAVTSQSGNTYQVDTVNETCTCPDHVYRGARCRHIEGAALAQELIGQGTTPGAGRDQDVNVVEALQASISRETAEEARLAGQEFSDDQHFYSDNIGEFRNDMDRLKNAPVPYEYENVLNGSNITFGIELEFTNGDSNAIAMELYDLGICSTPFMDRYHSAGQPGKWKLERDGSVTDGDRGGELVSPVLKDTPETWEQINTVCEVAKRHGAMVNKKTGAHVHISAEPLDGKRQRWRRLFKAFSGTEEAVFRFSGGEQGKFRNTLYAESSTPELNRAASVRLPGEGTINDFRNALSAVRSGIQWAKYKSINFAPFTQGVRNAIEIRAFNGSLTPGVIQANIKVAAGLIHTAERSRTRNQGDGFGSAAAASQKRGEMINSHADNAKDESTMIRFVDTFFSRKKDKEHIMSIMARNQWA